MWVLVLYLHTHSPRWSLKFCCHFREGGDIPRLIMTVYFCLWSQLPTGITVLKVNHKWWNFPKGFIDQHDSRDDLTISKAGNVTFCCCFSSFQCNTLICSSLLSLFFTSLVCYQICSHHTPLSLLKLCTFLRSIHFKRWLSCDYQWDLLQSPHSFVQLIVPQGIALIPTDVIEEKRPNLQLKP